MANQTDDFTTGFLSLVFIASAIALLVAAFTVLPFVILIASPVLLYLAYIKSPMYLEKQAKQRTLDMYQKALASTGKTTDMKEVTNYLSQHFPFNTSQREDCRSRYTGAFTSTFWKTA